MISFNQFIQKWNGKKCHHPQGISGQCVCLYRCYLDEVLGVPQSPSVAGARMIWNTTDETYFERIPYKFIGSRPQKGDIVIFNAFPGNPYGHVGMCTVSGLISFASFDSNWSTPLRARVEEHTYKYVIGWIRKRVTGDLASKINSNFRNIFKREPEKKDNSYFLSRIGNGIETEAKLVDVMKFWAAQPLSKWLIEREKVLGG